MFQESSGGNRKYQKPEDWWHRKCDRSKYLKYRAGKKVEFNDNRKAGYLSTSVAGVPLPAHRIAWFLYYGNDPQNNIDHIDGDYTNNKISNLRDVTKQINNRNAKKRINNTSGVTGVGWRKDRKRWIAYYAVNGNNKCLGTFKNIEDAIKAREKWMREHGYSLGFTKRHGIKS